MIHLIIRTDSVEGEGGGGVWKSWGGMKNRIPEGGNGLYHGVF